MIPDSAYRYLNRPFPCCGFLSAWLGLEMPPGVFAYGVYGEAPYNQNSQSASGWAGYFAGDAMVTGDGWILNDQWQVSDEQFKSDIEEITSASTILASLAPKKYSFIAQEHPHLHFPDGEHYGLIAQELEEILPLLVRSTVLPTVHDTLGNLIPEAINMKGVNYIVAARRSGTRHLLHYTLAGWRAPREEGREGALIRTSSTTQWPGSPEQGRCAFGPSSPVTGVAPFTAGCPFLLSLAAFLNDC